MDQIRKRVRKISTSVFRGRKAEYNFEVFPISPWLADCAAVFIFSRRVVDKRGRAHHLVSCLGETDSLEKEIKRHKRARCVKGSEANVVCILKSQDGEGRSEVIDDLVSARKFGCVRGVILNTKGKVARPRPNDLLQFKPKTNARKSSNGSESDRRGGRNEPHAKAQKLAGDRKKGSAIRTLKIRVRSDRRSYKKIAA